MKSGEVMRDEKENISFVNDKDKSNISQYPDSKWNQESLLFNHEVTHIPNVENSFGNFIGDHKLGPEYCDISSGKLQLRGEAKKGKDDREESLGAGTDWSSNSRSDNTSDLTFSKCDRDETSLRCLHEALKPKRFGSVAEIPHETCSSLGADLLLMYLNQENCDCWIAVDGEKFPSHKCILSARSEYFEAMLGGYWVESQSELITLEGVKAKAVEQLMLFLYGGVLVLPSKDASADLMELFLVADMYGVSSLNKVHSFYLRRDLCHFFHKPCPTCILSAADALSLCHNFNLEDMEQRCLKWIGKNFPRIWPCKTFAGLSDSLKQLSLRSIIGQFTAVNVLDIIVECNRLTSSLPRVKWTESVLCLLTQLMDAAIEFTSSNFVQVIKMPAFLQWAQGATWKASALESIFISAIDSLPIDTACNVFQALLHLQATLLQDKEESSKGSQAGAEDEVTQLLDTMVQRCERFLRKHIYKVLRSSEWPELPKSVQARIMETSAYLSLADLPDVKPKVATKKPVRHVVLPRPTSGLEMRKPKTRGSGSGTPSTVSFTRTRTSQVVTVSSRSTEPANLTSKPQGYGHGINVNQTSQTSGMTQGRAKSIRDKTVNGQIHTLPASLGARSKSKTGTKTLTPLKREVNSKVSSGMGSQITSQNKSSYIGPSLSKPDEELHVQTEDETDKKPQGFMNINCENTPSSMACSQGNYHASSIKNDVSTETEYTQAGAEASENFIFLPDSVNEFEDGERNQLMDTCVKVGAIELDEGLQACAETEMIVNSGSDHSFSHPDHCRSFEQCPPSHQPENPAINTSEFFEKLSPIRKGIPTNLIECNGFVDQRLPSQEPSPSLRRSHLPVITKSSRQRWSMGSGDSVGSEQHHVEAADNQEVHAALQQVQSLPVESQDDIKIGAKESAIISGDSLPASSNIEIMPPAELKVVKMSRPLSVGFVIPPN
ncbi:hypothetical protein RRG08_056575 [Elysia crispata]|uniref:BTB domain-containing protein n=1 Tax=Elysia crispata TaxID=231223 RepID=A0AAE1ALY0_9GAST|nr:hypothetical protein RRG08_056575 [Elysia crispata]